MVLEGRTDEVAQLEALVAGAVEGRSGVLVLRGAPGIGKTALLDELVRHARGVRVLRATGEPRESQLAFAGLSQLLGPCAEEVRPALLDRHRAVLDRVLGRSEELAGDRLTIGAMLLGALAAAAPAAVVVDDAQWLDESSLDALRFAGRRLGAEATVLVMALRDDAPPSGLPERVLAPLEDAAADALLARRGLAPALRAPLLARAGGNPLALLELEPGASPGQVSVPVRLRDAYAERIAALPRQDRALLEIAAAAGSGTVASVLAATQRDERSALAALETSRLVTADGAALRWSHPLAREAVLELAGAAGRREAHLALVGHVGPDEAAWHRAQAAVGPDDDVASALEAAAGRSARRGAHAVAADALERAAELTQDPARRDARAVAAATAAWHAGQGARAEALLDRTAEPAPLRADSARIRGLVELHRGSPARASALLAEAAGARAGEDPASALLLAVASIEAASLAGLPPALPFPIDHAGEAEPALRALIAGVLHRFAGREQEAGTQLRRAVELGASAEDAQRALWAGAAAFFAGDEPRATALHERAVTLARSTSDAGVLPFALTFLAHAHLWGGRLAHAEADADDAARLARDAGQENLLVQIDALLAGVAAWRGDEARCRTLADGARAVARQRGLVLAEGAATTALAELELASGAPATAFDRLERLVHGPGAHPAHRYACLPTLVEAAARAGDAERARPDAAALGEWAQATGSAWALPLAARSRALTAATPGEAERHFLEARALHHAHLRPLDRARTELLHGELLRRRRRKAEARPLLRSALETWEDAGVPLWAERARAELRAAGESARRRGTRALERLTPQELQVARLVAQGASNREAAAALYLSPRTVEYHLHKVFRKLGVHGRAELAALVTRAETG